MREGTTSHSEMVSRLDALIDDFPSKRVFHVHFSEHPPLFCIEAPVTTYTFAVLKDIQYLDTWRRLAESMVSTVREASAEGFLGGVFANVLEDVQAIQFLSGWESIEVRASIAHLLCHPFDKLADLGPYEVRHGREAAESYHNNRGVYIAPQRFTDASRTF